MSFRLTRKNLILAAVAILLLGYLFCLPRKLFKGVSYSTVVESAEGDLLGARIAADQQWRFPPCDAVPERFATALVQFEDRHFWHHPGVNPFSMLRAARDNIRSGHVVSGGSTITMQVIRLSRQKERTVWQKMIESVLATRLELRHSKRKILALYASHAPFGGNVVGLEAASWRYFGRPASELSWGESATLAVLPNAPATLHPGRGREELLQKRNRLLKRLLDHGDISPETYEASCEEPLPDEPLPLPSLASHYVERCPRGERTRSGISLPLQMAVEAAVNRRSDELAREGIADMAALVIDNATGQIVAYVGNASLERERPGRQVDIASSPRSTGSILKPFLYAAALQDGTILPRTLLADVPVNLSGFAPQNFDRQFYGAVPADEALARSLNVPSVFLLRQYGIPKFWSVLRDAGLSTITESPEHYGLSLILGGAEARLDEITAAYSAFVRGEAPFEDALARWYTYEALKEVNRPDQLDWRLIGSVRKAAWKTGTSYGFRDAWAVGMTPAYTIGVWAGNAEGQGVPGLVGARTAGPVLFDILNLLPRSDAWFPEPSGGIWADVCKDSGHLAGPDCPAVSMQLPEKGLDSDPCPYHGSGEFVLPPAMEWYYRQKHPEYTGAVSRTAGAAVQFIYPQSGAVLALPRQLSGEVEGIVFRVAHHRPDATLWWHLDRSYVGETTLRHELLLAPAPGPHTITVVDQDGSTATVSFTIAQ
ncbi:MAG: penicillin-binding protein 1C [Bacteroidales bacterium]|nr:penicillin-binding protein 1C [Bacteroidales bacterium]